MQTFSVRLTRDDLSCPWGLRVHGGSETGIPLSVDEVLPGSPAEGVFQRGDVIKLLNNHDVQTLNIEEVEEILQAPEPLVNCIIERKDMRVKIGGPIANTESKVSVKSARKKFLVTENAVPKPFIEFGTCFEKKSDSLPTNVKLDLENTYKSDKPRYNHNQTEDLDDQVDYSFMTLSVHERKKLFTSPDDNIMSRTMPRQRARSVRPTSKVYNPAPVNVPFGLSRYNENRITARTSSQNQSFAPSKYQNSNLFMAQESVQNSINDKYATVALTHDRHRDDRCIRNIESASDQRSPSNWDTGIIGSRNGIQSQIFRCGSNNRNASNYERRNEDGRPLVVKTYQIQSSPSSRFSKNFHPAYSAGNQDMNRKENWSNISIRSEPNTKSFENNFAHDQSMIIHSNGDKTSHNQNMCLGVIRIGHQNSDTHSISPSFTSNKPVWTNDPNSSRSQFKPPINQCYATVNPVAVSRPYSNVTINPIRHTTNRVREQMPQINKLKSAEGGSDF